MDLNCTLKSRQKSRLRSFRKNRKGTTMKFNEEQIKKLKQNPNVLTVLPDKIFYTQEFKEKAIQGYALGKSAKQIFIEAGFNLSELSQIPDYASKILSKWRKTKSPNNIHFSPKKKRKEKQTDYQKMKARLEYLEAENEFLKKLSALCNEYGA